MPICCCHPETCLQWTNYNVKAYSIWYVYGVPVTSVSDQRSADVHPQNGVRAWERGYRGSRVSKQMRELSHTPSIDPQLYCCHQCYDRKNATFDLAGKIMSFRNTNQYCVKGSQAFPTSRVWVCNAWTKDF